MSKRTRQLLNENNQLERGIQSAAAKEALTNMVVYIRSAHISPYDQEKVRRDVTQMILEGEQRGAPVQEVIGDDYRLFCDEVIGEIPPLKPGARILSACRDVLLAADILVGLWFLSQCIQQLIKPGTWPYLTLTLGNLASILLITAVSFALVQAMCKNAFSRWSASGKKEALLFFLALFLLLLLCMGVNVFLTRPAAAIHVLAAAGGIVLLFLLYKILDAKLD